MQVIATGLCGSDLHYFLHGANGSFKLQHPMCLGHESAGVVVAVGPPAADNSSSRSAPLWSVGDRVAIEAGVPCRNANEDCERCAEGRYNLCPRMRFASSAKTAPHIDGTLQKYMNWPAWLLHAIPSNVSMLSASLLEPLCVVWQGFERARFCKAPEAAAQEALRPEPLSLQVGDAPVAASKTKSESILVLGAGAVGLLACAAAKGRGAHFVAVVDIDEGRLQFAKRMGWVDAIYKLPIPGPSSQPPSHTNCVPAVDGAALETSKEQEQLDERGRRKKDDEASVASAQATAEKMLASFAAEAKGSCAKSHRTGFDLVFECTGVPSCVQAGIFATRPGGRVALIGMGHPIQSAFPIGAAALREVDIIGVFRYANVYPVAIEMLRSGALGQRDGDSRNGCGGIENLVSHRFALESANKAFETMRNGKSEDGTGVIKVFIVDDELLARDEQARKSL